MKKDSIKLIALPLTTQPPKPEKYGLIYLYHPKSNPIGTRNLNQSKPPWINRITDFGLQQWLKMSKAHQTNWKFKVYTKGESLMDKISFEEWSMKSIEPITLPNSSSKLNSIQSHIKKSNSDSVDPIELLYPNLIGPSDRLLEWLKHSLIEREPYHRKWMKYNLLISPLTLPFAILPIIPNLPFFYIMWRAWSHWRAYRATKYLKTMMNEGLIIPRESNLLNKVYNESRMIKEEEEEEEKDRMVLNEEMILRLKEEFQWDQTCIRELERAVYQAKLRCKANQDRMEKKEKLD
ncbi:mitochondrial K+-H+ exchange-related-domain-containing protein [Melampsora americana]|nr:mitochondrial K+-H+ exchange-related-domain-containing protein [Melampsora americana]